MGNGGNIPQLLPTSNYEQIANIYDLFVDVDRIIFGHFRFFYIRIQSQGESKRGVTTALVFR